MRAFLFLAAVCALAAMPALPCAEGGHDGDLAAPMSVDVLHGPAPSNAVVLRAADDQYVGEVRTLEGDTQVEPEERAGALVFAPHFAPGPNVFVLSRVNERRGMPSEHAVSFEVGTEADTEAPRILATPEARWIGSASSGSCGGTGSIIHTIDVPAIEDDFGVALVSLSALTDVEGEGELVYGDAKVITGKPLELDVKVPKDRDVISLELRAFDHAGNVALEQITPDDRGCAQTSHSSLGALAALAVLLVRRRR